MDVYPLPAILPPNDSKGPALVNTAWVFLGVSTVLVFGRLYSKIFKLKRFSLDDALILFAWVMLPTYVRLLWNPV